MKEGDLMGDERQETGGGSGVYSLNMVDDRQETGVWRWETVDKRW